VVAIRRSNRRRGSAVVRRAPGPFEERQDPAQTIELGSFAGPCGFKLERETAVHTLGLLVDRRRGVLAPFYDSAFLPRLQANAGIAMVLTTPELYPLVPEDRGVALCAEPLEAFYRLHCALFETGFYRIRFAHGIAADARIHPTAAIADHDVQIGSGVVIGANAVIEAGTCIGDHAVVGPGTVVGAEGFEIRRVDGKRLIVPHGGGVRLGAGVTIQANSAIDRALFGGFTEIGEATFIDNLVHVAHAVTIGKRGRIAAGACVGGSTLIGDDVVVGPGAVISSSLCIGDRARITLGAVVTLDVPADAHVSGNFAIAHQRLLAHLKTIR
jgi:acetyltransferase-like isoleucine patch superfamily enzyme